MDSDLIMVLLVLYIVFISCCLAIIFLSDSDIPTFIASHFGKNPGNVYSGKVVWITGASSGIGEGLAKEYANWNAKLVLSARRKDELERVKKECLAANPKLKSDNILIVPFDMTNLSAHEESFKTIIAHFGKLDVLISNAGRSQRAQWQDIDLQVDRELFDLNVFSLVHLNRIVLRHFLDKNAGHLAVVSSIAGVIGAPFSGTYSGSKFALHGYFDSLRNELRTTNIQVSILCPGPTFSQLLGQCFTAKPGETFKQEMQSSDKRMTAERCAQLMVVAMANGIEQSWISIFPIVPLVYLQAYFPYISAKLSAVLGRRGVYMKLRDSRDTLKKEN